MNDQDFDFQIDSGIEAPKRVILGRPSGSKYPVEKMAEGQSFFIPLKGEENATSKDKEGNVKELTVAEDLERKQRQKQSYFSQLGKKLGLSLQTVAFADGKDYNPNRADIAGEAGIGVWHRGPRKAEDDAAAKDDVTADESGAE